jgi:hypothetical protein
MPTRTAVLGARLAPAGVPFVFATVPAGQTWIAKSAFVNDQGGLGGQCFVWVSRSGGIVCIFAYTGDLTTIPFFEWEGWVVAEPGDVFEVYAPDTDCVLWLSGTKLIGVAS